MPRKKNIKAAKTKSKAIIKAEPVVKDAVVVEDVDKDNAHCYEIHVNSFKTAKEYACWGTYGKLGNQPRKYVRLIDCETSHLQAILRTQFQIRNSLYERIIKSILDDRKEPYVAKEEG